MNQEGSVRTRGAPSDESGHALRQEKAAVSQGVKPTRKADWGGALMSKGWGGALMDNGSFTSEVRSEK